MNGFDRCREVEAEGLARIYAFLKVTSDDGRYVRIEKGRLVPKLQQEIGDVLLNRNGGTYSAEVKIERVHTGNLFLETISNGTPGWYKPGWLHTNEADLLLYHFLDRPGSLYVCSLPRLKQWAFRERRVPCHPNIWSYPEKQGGGPPQQLNTTYGHIVPITVLKEEVRLKELDITTGTPVPSEQPALFGDV